LLQSSLTPSKSFTPSFHLSILDALASESMPTLSLFPLKTSITSYFVLSLDLYFLALPFHDLPFLPFIYPSLPSSVFIGLSFFIFFGISCDLPFACHVVCRPTMFFSNYIYSLRIYTHWTMEWWIHAGFILFMLLEMWLFNSRQVSSAKAWVCRGCSSVTASDRPLQEIPCPLQGFRGQENYGCYLFLWLSESDEDLDTSMAPSYGSDTAAEQGQSVAAAFLTYMAT